ncbi:MAG: FlgD immunoglobulin-like domain containing protein, partial [Candidatus Cloacimonetes bacterium]|nr:FlgD immunoglobulin-like domain containing protein [Candidatus Cloacimonadota bacterium]
GSLNRQASFAATGYVDNEDAIYAPVIDRLKQNYPNPFNPNTTIAFELARAQNVSLDIFNVKGQKVRNLRSGFMAAGNHSIAWDATDDFGKALASGLYFYRLQSNQSTFTRKMLLMK